MSLPGDLADKGGYGEAGYEVVQHEETSVNDSRQSLPPDGSCLTLGKILALPKVTFWRRGGENSIKIKYI